MHTALIPWLTPETILDGAGPFAILVVCAIVFAETGLLIGFILPGDTLLLITGLLANTAFSGGPGLGLPLWAICLAIGVAAFIGGEVGYLIGHRFGPRIFERKETGLLSLENVEKTNAFFARWGAWAIILARFVPVVRSFAPVAAGVAHMNYRKYSLFNLIGALIWGAGVTAIGYALGFIPPVARFVSAYIDVILVAAVVFTLGPILVRLWMTSRKAKRTAAIADVPTVEGTAEERA